MENLGKEIENGFQDMAKGIKDAGQRRNEELVAKQGYVGFRNEIAAQAYRDQNPTWICKMVDGEYRFYPPEKNDILENFKEVFKEYNGVVIATINMIADSPKCRYSLKTIDKQTGSQTVVYDEVVDFNGRFAMETLPSMYFALSNGLPVIDQEKSYMDKFSVDYCNVDQSRFIRLGNLTQEQLQLVQSMKAFVDNQYGLNISEETGRSV